MIVYHGSIEIVKNPLVNLGRDNLDFGKGFYLTNIKEQAISWALRPLNADKPKFLNIYDLDLKEVKERGFKIMQFDNYDRKWLDFVIGNRQGKTLWKPYDIIIGGIANDRVFNTVELYANNLISAQEALTRLQYHKPNNQICILKQDIIDSCLKFLKSETLE